MLVANDWREVNSTIVHRAEETGMDALGNAYRRRSSDPQMSEDDYPVYDTRYAPGSSRVSSVTKREPEVPEAGFIEDVTVYQYDFAGNGIRTFQEIGADPSTGYTVGREVETSSYYGADGKLRAFQKCDVRRNDSGWKMAGVWEEYRYDPLGRRILVRTRGDGGMCNVGRMGVHQQHHPASCGRGTNCCGSSRTRRARTPPRTGR